MCNFHFDNDDDGREKEGVEVANVNVGKREYALIWLLLYTLTAASASLCLRSVSFVLLNPMTPPPHFRRCSSNFCAKLASTAETMVDRSFFDEPETSVMARTEAVFMWTTVPNLALPLTMQ